MKDKQQDVAIMKIKHEYWLLTPHPQPTFSKFAFCFFYYLSSCFHLPTTLPPGSVHPSTLWSLVTSPVLSVLNLTFLLYWISWFSSGNYHTVFCFTCFAQVFSLIVLPQSTITPAFTSEVLLCLSNLVQRSVALCLSSPSPQYYLLGQGHHLITFTIPNG